LRGIIIPVIPPHAANQVQFSFDGSESDSELIGNFRMGVTLQFRNRISHQIVVQFFQIFFQRFRDETRKSFFREVVRDVMDAGPLIIG
jgi:hypothetical protein